MVSRLYLPGMFWLGVMILFFSMPVQHTIEPIFRFSGRTLLEFLLFTGFVHIWIAALKKQVKSEPVRRNAVWIVISIALLIVLLMELGLSYFEVTDGIRKSSLLINSIGALLGIATFKLVYRNCCL